MELTIDCEQCTAPNLNPDICKDCVVSFLLSSPSIGGELSSPSIGGELNSEQQLEAKLPAAKRSPRHNLTNLGLAPEIGRSASSTEESLVSEATTHLVDGELRAIANLADSGLLPPLRFRKRAI
jgi:hypothetical protein